MAEYIERETALKEFEKVCNVCMALVNKPMCGDCSVADTVRKVKSIPAADVRPVKWIPVTERLPEDDKAVLAHVYWPEYGDTMICYGHWHKGWFHLFHHVEGELISGYVVTHWMPLPEPPKEET